MLAKVQMGDDEMALRQQLSVMARQFDDLSRRQQNYVRVIKNLEVGSDPCIAFGVCSILLASK